MKGKIFFFLIISIAFSMILFWKPASATSPLSNNPAGIFQNTTPSATPTAPEPYPAGTASGNETVSQVPKQQNPGLVIGGSILFAIILLSILVLSRRKIE